MATERFLTAEQSVQHLLKTMPPLYFDGGTKTEWKEWRRNFRRKMSRYLGPKPEPVPLEVETLDRIQQDGYTREKIIFNPDAFSSIPAYILIPDSVSADNPAPAVLCAHGHGIGKDGAVGIVEDYQKQYAVELAQRGFVTLAPDWRCFGERKDRDEWVRRPGRDGCNVAYLALGYFGYQLLQLNISDGQRCLDYLQSRPEVDGRRLGCMGCSFGGTMTTYISAFDRRIKAAVIVCYLSTLIDALGDRGRGNTCGSQFMFGLRAAGDIADVAGLIAPRACMVQIGSDDQCFIESDALAAFEHLEKIYNACGKRDRLVLDHFEGEHEIDLEPGIAFLEERL
ncbi:MAG: dienelactone hydrolase family protein [Candidatus Poribacteria bacterium]|nr:dienelactone hydrolase family protein [Candidatus Poribacteria bacterium]